MSINLSELEILRRQSLSELYTLGIEPYPADMYEVNYHSTAVLKNFDQNPESDSLKNICIAGRLMSIRDMGKAAFAVIQDASGKIQLYIKRDEICPGDDKSFYDNVFKKLLDIGDIIGIVGHAFKTKTGETSIHVRELKLLTKSLRPLPVVKEKDGEIFDAFVDPEQRYRQRYVDLIVNPHVRETFRKRTQLTNSMRTFLNERLPGSRNTHFTASLWWCCSSPF